MLCVDCKKQPGQKKKKIKDKGTDKNVACRLQQSGHLPGQRDFYLINFCSPRFSSSNFDRYSSYYLDNYIMFNPICQADKCNFH